jgi:aldehyde:ferredoxin oxidoreductase
MDHLRNRVTLEINAKINSDAAFKEQLYGGRVSAAPNSYVDKELAVRRCENIFAVGDAVGMCRFTTQLLTARRFPATRNLRAARQRHRIFSDTAELDRVGLNIMGASG